MKTASRTRLRMTAYHSVDASPVPRTGCHGRGGMALAGVMPASASWRWVAT